MQQVKTLNECMPLIKSFGARVLRRVHAAGARTIEYADVIQELSIAWHLAAQNFDPTKEVQFTTYLVGAMRHHINRWAERELRRNSLEAVSLDASYTPDGEQDSSLESVITVFEESSEDTLLANENKERIYGRLSPRAKQFCQLLEAPPKLVVEELRGLQAKAKWCRDRGFHAAAPSSLTTAIVFDIMAAPRQERSVILKEVRAAIQKVNR